MSLTPRLHVGPRRHQPDHLKIKRPQTGNTPLWLTRVYHMTTQNQKPAQTSTSALQDFQAALDGIIHRRDQAAVLRDTLQAIGKSFDNASLLPAVKKLAQALPEITDYTSRYTTVKLIADIGSKNDKAAIEAAFAIATFMRQEKDSGLRYMTGNALRDMTIAQPAAAKIATSAIADTLLSEKDSYAQRALELSLVALSGINTASRDMTLATLGQSLLQQPDTLGRSLTSGLMADIGTTSAEAAQHSVALLSYALHKETTPQVANRLAQDIAGIAQTQPAVLPQAVETMISVIQNNKAGKPEKTFAAAHALRLLGDMAPAFVATEIAAATKTPAQTETQRRIYILALGTLAGQNEDAAQTAGKTLLESLKAGDSPLNRRHSIKGIMAAVHNGFDSKTTGQKLFAHLEGERDRETREEIMRALVKTNHPLPAFKRQNPTVKM